MLQSYGFLKMRAQWNAAGSVISGTERTVQAGRVVLFYPTGYPPRTGLRDMNPLTDHFFKKMVDGKGLFGAQLLAELAEEVEPGGQQGQQRK